MISLIWEIVPFFNFAQRSGISKFCLYFLSLFLLVKKIRFYIVILSFDI